MNLYSFLVAVDDRAKSSRCDLGLGGCKHVLCLAGDDGGEGRRRG